MAFIPKRDPVERAALWVFAFAILGALVPFFWIALGLLSFNARESNGDIYWQVVYITCPAWLLPGWSALKMCVLNGLLYGAIALVFAIILIRRKAPRK